MQILEHEVVPYQTQDWSGQACAKHPTWVDRTAPKRTSERSVPAFHNRGCSCHSSKTVQHSLACLAGCPLYAVNPPELKLDSELEYLCFDYFRYKTGPGFSGYFDSSVWSYLMLEACFIEPVVLQAVAALGAVSYRYELGITPQAFEFCGIADRLYQKALKAWSKQLARGTPPPEVQMILAKLFASFETFQDNPDIATRYMTNAFHQVLNREIVPLVTEEQRVSIALNLQTLRQYFLKLEHQAAWLFGHSADVTWHKLESFGPDLTMPEIFTSIEKARDFLFAQGRVIWALSDLGSISDKVSTTIAARNLMAWSKAYAGYSQVHRPTNDPLLGRIGRLLKWYREAAFLQLLLITPSDDVGAELLVPEMKFDQSLQQKLKDDREASLVAHFARLLLLSDGLLSENVPFASSALQYSPATLISGKLESLLAPKASSPFLSPGLAASRPSSLGTKCSLASSKSGGMGLMLGSASCRSSQIRHSMRSLFTDGGSSCGPSKGMSIASLGQPAPLLLSSFSSARQKYKKAFPTKEEPKHIWDNLGVYTIAERCSSFEELACEKVLEYYRRQSEGPNYYNDGLEERRQCFHA